MSRFLHRNFIGQGIANKELNRYLCRAARRPDDIPIASAAQLKSTAPLRRDALHHLPRFIEELDARHAVGADAHDEARLAALVGEADDGILGLLAGEEARGADAAMRIGIGEHLGAYALLV